MRLPMTSMLCLLSVAASAQSPQAELPARTAQAAQTVQTPAAPAAPASGVAAATALTASPAASPDALGAQTRDWVQLQISGAASAADARPMPGEIATRVYQRYVDSYTSPIPQQFPRQSFVGGTGSSAGAGSAAGRTDGSTY